MATKLRDRSSELARADAVGLGYADDSTQTWAAFRAAIEAGNEREIERLQGKLGLGQRHVEFAKLALRLDRECTEAVEAAEKATKRIAVIEAELAALERVSLPTVETAEKNAARVVALQSERQACRLAVGSHAACSGVRQACPQLFGLDPSKRPRAGIHHELSNFARQHLGDLDLYTRSWLDLPTIAQPRRRARVMASGVS